MNDFRNTGAKTFGESGISVALEECRYFDKLLGDRGGCRAGGSAAIGKAYTLLKRI